MFSLGFGGTCFACTVCVIRIALLCTVIGTTVSRVRVLARGMYTQRDCVVVVFCYNFHRRAYWHVAISVPDQLHTIRFRQ